MKALRIILMALAFISLQAHAKDGRNLAVNHANNAASASRIALVIGNSKYKEKSLSNPANDARDMAATLRELGFDVIDKIDVTQKEMNRAIALFGEKLNANTIALFYYAGHGMQVRGKNYLIPVDAEIAAETSVRAETVDVDTVLDQLNRSPLSIVILDACRNNPFERRFRSTGGGLAAMDAPKGTLIAYATSPGSVASDGTGRNGLYTQELLKAMRTPGLPVERMFKEVRRNVTSASGDTQTPWEMSSLTGEFYFKPGTQVANMEPIPAPVGGSVSLDDIKKQQESRGQWDKWQAGMKADFDKIVALNAEPDLQITAWDRFLANYTQKNPFSEEDEQLRTQAQGKKQAAQALKQEVERQQQQAAQTGASAPAETARQLTLEEKFAEMKRKAEAGDAKAQFELGWMYNKGYGVTSDNTKAMEWLQKATAQVDWFQKAAAQGDARAQLFLAIIYTIGNGVPKDAVKGAEWLQKAATQGDADAQYGLGDIYTSGELGVSKDAAKAVEWYQKAADQGNADAQFSLGKLYAIGKVVPRDTAKADEWFQKWAAQKGVNKYHELGDMYANGEGVPKDARKAVEWYQKAAAHGNADAQFSLGAMYANGKVVPKDTAKADEWLKKWAAQEVVKYNKIGDDYAHGWELPKDAVQAVKWYKKAATQGDSYAQYLIGNMYENGEGVRKDDAKAVEWYLKSAEQGDMHGQRALAWMYANGDGVPKDATKAVEWYQKAAIQGDGLAQSQLGQSYMDGKGVGKNSILAYAWSNLAAAQNMTTGKHNRDILEAKLTPAQRAEGQSIAANWKKGDILQATSYDTVSIESTLPPDNSNNGKGWVVADSHENTIRYYNPATIRKKGNMVKMWLLEDHKKAVKFRDDQKPYLSDKEQSEYDCKEKQRRLLNVSEFSGNMGSGEVFYSGDYSNDSEPPKWNAIVPESVGEALWEIACGKR